MVYPKFHPDNGRVVVTRDYEERTIVIVPPSTTPTLIIQKPVGFGCHGVREAWEAAKDVEVVREELILDGPRTPLQAYAAKILKDAARRAREAVGVK